MKKRKVSTELAHPSPKYEREAQIRKKIRTVSAWHHSINLAGVVTPGMVSPKTHEWVSQCIPLDLEGKRVLDIGAFDGYYSFLCERRGADVVAIDIDPEHLKSFNIAKEVLSSKVEYRILSVYDLEQLEGWFDYILFFGVIYHLRNPILALEKIMIKLEGLLFIESAYIKSLGSSAKFSWAKNGDPRTYWRPSAKCLERMCKLVGYKDVKTLAKRWYFPWRRGRILLRTAHSSHSDNERQL